MGSGIAIINERYQIETKLWGYGRSKLVYKGINQFKNSKLNQSISLLEKQIKIYQQTKFVSSLFVQKLQIKKSVLLPVSFQVILPEICEVQDIHRPFFQCRKIPFQNAKYSLIQQFIQGQYQRFTHNWNVQMQIKDQYCQALEHFSYQQSEHQSILCDLQGNRQGQNYILTDPIIHSIKQDYGLNDRGVAGINAIIRRHKCNEICQILQLHPIFMDELKLNRTLQSTQQDQFL